MSDLEQEYRRALRRYPSRWRRSHEEALIGVLLDNAEAQGRHHLSPADRRNLALNGARLRASRIAAVVLLVVALLLLANTVTLIVGGAGLNAPLILSAPPLPAPPAGGSYRVPSLQEPAWVVYLASVIVCILAGLGAGLLVLRNRKLDRAN